MAAALVMTLATPTRATMTEEQAFTCPLDGTAFTGRVLSSSNRGGGVDSDFCVWSIGESPLQYEVQVCPKCFYARRNEDFNKPLPMATKQRLVKALTHWRKTHPEVKDIDGVRPAQRWELAAVCVMVRHNQPEIVGDLWLRASWARRHTGLAGLNMRIATPMDGFEQLDGLLYDLRKAKGEAFVETLFRVVMLAQRVGQVKRRDAALGMLEKANLDAKQAEHLAQLRQAFADEAMYQERAIAAFSRAIEQEIANAERTAFYLYLIGDMNRRLGRNDEALKYYKQAASAPEVRDDVRDMCAFMVRWLTAE
jgi:tetratricopeptide (TPR) repeat protein